MPWAGFVKPDIIMEEHEGSTFLERLLEEKKELDQKRESLRKFMKSDSFQEIDPVQMTLLNIQIEAMNTYGQILLERIVRLGV